MVINVPPSGLDGRNHNVGRRDMGVRGGFSRKKNGSRTRKTRRAQEKRPAHEKNASGSRKTARAREKPLGSKKNGSRMTKTARA